MRGMAALDVRLENAGILNQLEAKELPDEITDDQGIEVEESADVSWLS